MSSSTITLGTRGSRLALAQTQVVADALQRANPKLAIATTVITTKGDVNHEPIPATTIGKAWFTAEIEAALRKRTIDLAVHSLKDLPPEGTPGLVTFCVLERADARDVLVSKHGETLAELPAGAVVGTDSSRRKAALLQARPDLEVRSIRGNVDTRLQKLQDEDYDALVLAAAGLDRLGLLAQATELLDPVHFVPAIGQGVLAAQIREDDHELAELLGALQHDDTVQVVAAEQAFSAIVGGGCTQPVGCYAVFSGSTVTVHGLVGSLDATHAVIDSRKGPAAQALQLAKSLATTLKSELAS